MICADFKRRGDRICLHLEGHAGYSDTGSDIVCAAVSGIFYALIGYLANECRGMAINKLSHGIADIECGIEGEEAMKQACIGILQIGLSYPGTVDVENSVWRWRISPAVYADKK